MGERMGATREGHDYSLIPRHASVSPQGFLFTTLPASRIKNPSSPGGIWTSYFGSPRTNTNELIFFTPHPPLPLKRLCHNEGKGPSFPRKRESREFKKE